MCCMPPPGPGPTCHQHMCTVAAQALHALLVVFWSALGPETSVCSTQCYNIIALLAASALHWAQHLGAGSEWMQSARNRTLQSEMCTCGGSQRARAKSARVHTAICHGICAARAAKSYQGPTMPMKSKGLHGGSGHVRWGVHHDKWYAAAAIAGMGVAKGVGLKHDELALRSRARGAACRPH